MTYLIYCHMYRHSYYSKSVPIGPMWLFELVLYFYKKIVGNKIVNALNMNEKCRLSFLKWF